MSRSIVLSAVGFGAAVLLFRKVKAISVLGKRRANFGLEPDKPDGAGAVPIILRNNSGVELYVRRWDVPDGKEIKGCVVLIHGDLLTSKNFENVAGVLTRAGFEVYAYDQVGYGLSGCKRGVERHIDASSEYTLDVARVVDFVKSVMPGFPCFLYGEDLGGTVAIDYACSAGSQGKISGLMLSSPMWRCPDVEGDVSGFANKFFPLALAPRWRVPCSAENLFPDPVDASAAKAAFDKPTTVRKVAEMRLLCRRVSKSCSKLAVPILVMHGTEDKRNDEAKSDDFQEGLRAAKHTEVYYRPYPGLKHGLVHDPESKQFPLRDMEAWMNKLAKDQNNGG